MKYILITMFALLITACTTVPEKEIIITKEFYTYDLPKNLTTSCKPKSPLAIETFASMTPEEQNTYLTKYTIDLLGDLKKCDNKVMGIKSYVEQQKTIMKMRNSTGVKNE